MSRKPPQDILDCRACELEIQGKEDLLTVTKIRQNPSRIDMLIVDYKWYTGIKESRSIWKATGIGVSPERDYLDHTFIVVPKGTSGALVPKVREPEVPKDLTVPLSDKLMYDLQLEGHISQEEAWADHVEEVTSRIDSSMTSIMLRYRGI